MNYVLTLDNPNLMIYKLMNEVDLKVAGPFDHLPIKDLIVSPISLVPISAPRVFSSSLSYHTLRVPQ